MSKIEVDPPSPAAVAAARAIHARMCPGEDWIKDNSDEERAEYLAVAAAVLESQALPGAVERKVIWGSLAALGTTLAVAGLEWAQVNLAGLAGVPSWAPVVVGIVAPPLIAFLAGYRAPHTERPDLGGVAR